jgi:hypothetical protein
LNFNRLHGVISQKTKLFNERTGSIIRKTWKKSSATAVSVRGPIHQEAAEGGEEVDQIKMVRPLPNANLGFVTV